MNTSEFKMFLLSIVEDIEKGRSTLEQVELSRPVVEGPLKEDGTPEHSQPETTIYIRLKNHK